MHFRLDHINGFNYIEDQMIARPNYCGNLKNNLEQKKQILSTWSFQQICQVIPYEVIKATSTNQCELRLISNSAWQR